ERRSRRCAAPGTQAPERAAAAGRAGRGRRRRNRNPVRPGNCRRMKKFWLLAAVSLLGACAIDETLEPPAELVEFEQRVDIERAWSVTPGGRSLWFFGGDKGSSLRLGLVPATDGTNVYVATHDGVVEAYR